MLLLQNMNKIYCCNMQDPHYNNFHDDNNFDQCYSIEAIMIIQNCDRCNADSVILYLCSFGDIHII